jgi:hypothetical protein
MPAAHDLDPDIMSEDQRLEKRRFDAYHAFEQMPPAISRAQFGRNPSRPNTSFELDT